MIAFVLRRLLQAISVMLVVGLIAFSLFRFVGDPVNIMLGQDTDARGPRGAARRSSGSTTVLRAVRALRGQRGAGRFRPQLPAGAAGLAR